MEAFGILPRIETLIGMNFEEPNMPKHCKSTALQINQTISSCSDPTNEGQPVLLCGNLIGHIVEECNEQFGRMICKFEIFSRVTDEPDKRQNKETDYSIFKVVNRCTYIVIEVKLSVGRRLTTADQDSLAQLFLEAVYIWKKEGSSEQNNIVLCILTDGTSWHMMKINIMIRPLQFLTLYSCSTMGVKPWDSNVSTICDYFVEHINKCYHRK